MAETDHKHVPGENLGASSQFIQDLRDDPDRRWYRVVHYKCAECGKEYLVKVWEEA